MNRPADKARTSSRRLRKGDLDAVVGSNRNRIRCVTAFLNSTDHGTRQRSVREGPVTPGRLANRQAAGIPGPLSRTHIHMEILEGAGKWNQGPQRGIRSGTGPAGRMAKCAGAE